MKKPVKIALWGLVVLCVLVMVATHLAGPALARSMTARLIEEMTGFDTELGELELSLWKRTIELTDVKLMDPSGIESGEAVWIRRLYAEPTWDAITGKRASFAKIELDIAELHLVQPKTGQANLEQLADNMKTWQSRQVSETPAPAEKSAASLPEAAEPAGVPAPVAVPSEPETQIDELTVRMGTVTVIDHSRGGTKPLTMRHEINREKTVFNVTDLDAVSEELLMEFTVNSLMEQIAEPLNELMPGLADELQGFLKQLSAPSPAGGEEGSDDPVEQFKDVLEGLL